MKYKSCHLIEHGIFFSLKEIWLCCYLPNEKSEVVKFVDPYDGGAIDWGKIADFREKIRMGLKKGQIPVTCEGCFNLEEKEWDESNKISNIYLAHWSHCNCDCTYCYFPDKNYYNNFKPYKALPILEEMKEKDIFRNDGYVAISGGEPAILDELDGIIDFLLVNDIRSIVVNSSGVKYSESIARGISTGKLDLTISLDCGDAELYKKIKQIDSFDTVVENIKIYAASQQISQENVRVKYIIIPGINDTKENIDKWIQVVLSAKVRKIILDLESSWFLNNRNNIQKHIYDLIQYVENQASELNLKIDYYSHADQLRLEKTANRRLDN